MKRLLGSLLIGLMLAIPQARAELRGQVHMLLNPEAPRAEWRRVILPGAYLAVFWSITVPAPAHAITRCHYSEFARSDEKGEYVMEGPNFVTAALAETSFRVYSPGLERVDFPYGGSPLSTKDITMARSTLAPEERLSRLDFYVDPECFGKKLNDPHGLLDAFRRILLDEAKSLQVDSEMGRRYLRSIEADIRRASGLVDPPGPVRAVILPSSGPTESNHRDPGQRR